MGGRISRRVIDQIKGKVLAKIKVLERDLPADAEQKAQASAVEALGLEKLAGEWDKAWKKRQEAEAEYQDVVKRAQLVVGANYYGTQSASLAAWLLAHKPAEFVKRRDAARALLYAGTEAGKEIARLQKLHDSVDLTLELAGSSAEVKAALREILEQIGE